MTGQDGAGRGDVVLVERVGNVAWVTLNRPDSLNAMDAQLMDDLRSALIELAEDSSVRCVGLRGAGRAFCAGGDQRLMSERREIAEKAPSTGALMDDLHRGLVRRSESSTLLASMRKPTVAVLQGHVIGGGLSLALACDFRLAGEGARLRVGFLSNALSGDFGISYLLESLLGTARAKEMLMLDPTLDAATALEWGLVGEVHPDETLQAAGEEFAARLGNGPTIALGRMKANILACRMLPMTAAIEFEALNQRVAAATADAAEAGKAFGERRQPNFIGR